MRGSSLPALRDLYLSRPAGDNQNEAFQSQDKAPIAATLLPSLPVPHLLSSMCREGIPTTAESYAWLFQLRACKCADRIKAVKKKMRLQLLAQFIQLCILGDAFCFGFVKCIFFLLS